MHFCNFIGLTARNWSTLDPVALRYLEKSKARGAQTVEGWPSILECDYTLPASWFAASFNNWKDHFREDSRRRHLDFRGVASLFRRWTVRWICWTAFLRSIYGRLHGVCRVDATRTAGVSRLVDWGRGVERPGFDAFEGRSSWDRLKKSSGKRRARWQSGDLHSEASLAG